MYTSYKCKTTNENIPIQLHRVAIFCVSQIEIPFNNNFSWSKH